jgi:hypothetical protein
MRAAYPQATVLLASARSGEGLSEWFDRVAGADTDTRSAPAVDYQVYAEGEALLGWCNGSFELSRAEPFDGNQLLLAVAEAVTRPLAAAGAEIAHFKMTLVPSGPLGDLAVLNLVGTDRRPELSHRLQEPAGRAELIVNLRAEADPEALSRAVAEGVQQAASAAGIRAKVGHLERFRPSPPSPTYRMATAESAL